MNDIQVWELNYMNVDIALYSIGLLIYINEIEH